MKKLILLLSILLLVVPCIAQIDYQSQIKNKATDTSIVGVKGGVMWSGPTDPAGAPVVPTVVQYVNSITKDPISGSCCIATFPKPVTAGNLLIINAVGSGNQYNDIFTDTLGTAFIINYFVGINNSVWYGKALSSGVDTISMPAATSGSFVVTGITIFEITGVSSILDAHSYSDRTLPTSITTTRSNDFVFEGVSTVGGLTCLSPPPQFTLLQGEAIPTGDVNGLCSMYKVVNTPGLVSTAFTTNFSHDSWLSSNTLAFIPNPGPGPGNNGDYFVNSLTNTLFGPKSLGLWPTTGIQLGGSNTQLGGSNTAFNDTVVGTLDGANTTFTLSHTPTTGTLMLFRNGSLQALGISYTLSGSTVTFLTGSIPTTGDYLTALYQY